MTTQARALGVGVFVLAGLGVLVVGLFMIGDRQMAFAETFMLHTEFSRVTGLQPGAIVRIAGARAGTITAIVPPARPSQKFRVELQVVETLHQLVRTDSVATIETEGLVGGNYLGIGTGSDSAPRVSPGATIAGREPYDLSELMQQMGATVARVNDTIDGMKDEVRDAVVAVTGTVGAANALIVEVGPDVKRLTAASARITTDVAEVVGGVRAGRGLVGRLVTDDALYTRVTAIAAHTEETASQARRLVESARAALDAARATDGPVQGMTADVRQTMSDARGAMAGLAENMDALKHNLLLRGYFNRRGYFDLARVSPAAYRKGALQTGGGREVRRVWVMAERLFATGPDGPDSEQLTQEGRQRLDEALGPFLPHLVGGILVVEGYAQQGGPDQQYRRSHARGTAVRTYLLGRFGLDPEAVGAMPLSSESTGSPRALPWDGVALAVILPKGSLPSRR